MTPSSDRILDAALELFSSYGFRRTSMSEIARAADLSRTSLYKRFKTKEEVFAALSARINEEVLVAVTGAAATEGPAVERLVAILDAWVSWAFELLCRSPHGHELIDEKNRICADTSAEANARFEALVAQVLADLPSVREDDAAEEAAVLVRAAKGIVLSEHDGARLRDRVERLARVFVAGLAAAG